MSHGDSISVLEITHKRQARLENSTTNIEEDRISDEAASSVTGDEPMTMTLAEVDDSSDAQYSYKSLMTVWMTPLKDKSAENR